MRKGTMNKHLVTSARNNVVRLSPPWAMPYSARLDEFETKLRAQISDALNPETPRVAWFSIPVSCPRQDLIQVVTDALRSMVYCVIPSAWVVDISVEGDEVRLSADNTVS